MVKKSTGPVSSLDIDSNPKTLFLFGDNTLRIGRGGQAKYARGKPNCIGIRTKKKPSMEDDAFLTDKELENNKLLITSDINDAINNYKVGGYTDIVIPPIGVGLARLPIKAPKTYEWLLKEIDRLEEEIKAYDQHKLTKFHDI